jgi:hypothetical protein
MLTLPVQASGDYRIKIEVTDTYDNFSTTVTCYEYLQEDDDAVLPENHVIDSSMTLREEDLQ